jgi:hypothetical protein
MLPAYIVRPGEASDNRLFLNGDSSCATMLLDLNQLRIFYAEAHESSLAAASELFFITPQAVTDAIRNTRGARNPHRPRSVSPCLGALFRWTFSLAAPFLPTAMLPQPPSCEKRKGNRKESADGSRHEPPAEYCADMPCGFLA